MVRSMIFPAELLETPSRQVPPMADTTFASFERTSSAMARRSGVACEAMVSMGSNDAHVNFPLAFVVKNDVARQEKPDIEVCGERTMREQRSAGAENHVRAKIDIELLLQSGLHVDFREDAKTLIFQGFGDSGPGLFERATQRGVHSESFDVFLRSARAPRLCGFRLFDLRAHVVHVELRYAREQLFQSGRREHSRLSEKEDPSRKSSTSGSRGFETLLRGPPLLPCRPSRT